MTEDKKSADNVELKGAKRTLVLFGASSLKGLGETLRALDKNTTGRDDFLGSLCKATGGILIAFASEDRASLVTGIQALNDVTGEWLDENEENNTTEV